MAGLAGDSSSLTEVILGNKDSLREENTPNNEDIRLLLLLEAAAEGGATAGVGFAERGLRGDATVVDGSASSTSASSGEEEGGGEAEGGRDETTLRRVDNIVLCGNVYGDVVGGSCTAEAGRRSLAEGARLTTADLGRSFSDVTSSR